MKSSDNAITWSLLSQIIHKSSWSTVLVTDSTATRKVKSCLEASKLNLGIVIFMTRLSSVYTVLVTIAGIVAPVGLSRQDEISETTFVAFVYHLDNSSSFGPATSPREDIACNRQFGAAVIPLSKAMAPTLPCPGQDVVYAETPISYTGGRIYNISISKALQRIFSSATNASTVAGAFDMQPRNYDLWVKLGVNNSQYVGGIADAYQSVLMGNTVQAIEGLIVDSRPGNAAVGLRNHTLPQTNGQQARWIEDLLYIEPETMCVDTNLTLNFTMTNNPTEVNSSLVMLTDM